MADGSQAFLRVLRIGLRTTLTQAFRPLGPSFATGVFVCSRVTPAASLAFLVGRWLGVVPRALVWEAIGPGTGLDSAPGLVRSGYDPGQWGPFPGS
jgi:hypothetical protein